jgi:predicted metal-dependent HD superfamily phosphohydrolase
MNAFIQFNKILQLYIKDNEILLLPKRWAEEHRYYHTVTHLNDIIQNIEKHSAFQFLNIYEKHALLLAAFFHDAIYNPKETNNEDKSIELFRKCFKNNDPQMINAVCEIIECTKYRKRPFNNLPQIFWDADNKSFFLGYEVLLKNEHLIRKEYSHLSNKKYKEKRIEFLNSCKGLFNLPVDNNIDKLIKFIEKSY